MSMITNKQLIERYGGYHIAPSHTKHKGAHVAYVLLNILTEQLSWRTWSSSRQGGLSFRSSTNVAPLLIFKTLVYRKGE